MRSGSTRYRDVARVQRLAELGHELRRPEGDHLRDGIYELRARLNYRLPYFFHGQLAAVLLMASRRKTKCGTRTFFAQSSGNRSSRSDRRRIPTKRSLKDGEDS